MVNIDLKRLGTDYLETVTIVLFIVDPAPPSKARQVMLQGNI
jgi:hypothetical protein